LARKEAAGHLWFFTMWAIIPFIAVLIILGYRALVADSGKDVVLYAAQDQIYAEPILQEFERATGLRVRVVYDSEAVKTVGLANRLLAEQGHPQCDVFWGNEELRTRQLAAREVFRETNGWAAFGYRSRRLAVSLASTNVPSPGSWRDLTNAIYRRRVALAYPLFGSTATHLLALRNVWGEQSWLTWCRALAANEPFIVDGNSVAVQFLTRGQADLALTDSDDIIAASRHGSRIQPLPVDGDTLLIPNTVAVVRRCKHPEPAEKLFAYLQSGPVLDHLIKAGALEGRSAPDSWPATLRPNWDAVLNDLESGMAQLKLIFRK
jgi:iron(III) transport system substrate-binding protein